MASSASQELAPERSIFAVDPMDDFATMIGDWIWTHGKGQRNLEIEGKIGQIMDQSTGERIQLPVRNETIVDLQRTRFESNMTSQQHGSFNKLLNNLVARSAEPSYPGARVSYLRRKEVDYFHPTSSGRVRVTRDAETLAIKPDGIVQKQRLADLNIHCPTRRFDYRISINVENPAEEPASEHVSMREKNRLSYSHQNFIVDLTQVIMPEKPSEPMHELEVEIKDADQLLRSRATVASANGANSAAQEWTPYDDQILIFLNNIRMLIRNASGPDERR